MLKKTMKGIKVEMFGVGIAVAISYSIQTNQSLSVKDRKKSCFENNWFWKVEVNANSFMI